MLASVCVVRSLGTTAPVSALARVGGTGRSLRTIRSFRRERVGTASVRLGSRLLGSTLGGLVRSGLLGSSGSGAVGTVATSLPSTSCDTATSASTSGRKRGVEDCAGHIGNGHPLLLAMTGTSVLFGLLSLIGLFEFFLSLLLLLTLGNLGGRPHGSIGHWGYICRTCQFTGVKGIVVPKRKKKKKKKK